MIRECFSKIFSMFKKIVKIRGSCAVYYEVKLSPKIACKKEEEDEDCAIHDL